MSKLKVFFVGGFLGSGKTTAIERAAAYLHQNIMKVAVITNDQGTHQVDTKFIKGHNIPSEEVAGGCFCCNYNELGKSIESLQLIAKPDIIFAESVGSCTDLVATVINPLLSYNPEQYEIVLSVFADIRLLVKFLQDGKAIFYDNVNYIYQIQLKEADIIVVNKIDLLNQKQLKFAKQLIESEYRGKVILYQNSLSEESIKQWLLTCDNFKNPSIRTTLEVNYDIYGAGEAELAWLDEEIGIITTDKTAVSAAYTFIQNIYDKIVAKGYPIGHLKFLLDNGQQQKKVSYTTLFIADKNDADFSETDRIIILVNARIQVEPILLQSLVSDIIIETEIETDCKIIEYTLSSFQPGYPQPTHRISA